MIQNRTLHFFRNFTNHFIQNFYLHNVKLNVTYKFKKSSITNPNLIQQLSYPNPNFHRQVALTRQIAKRELDSKRFIIIRTIFYKPTYGENTFL